MNIEGERKYYSNGKIEKIIEADGTTYSFNTIGELDKINTKNKEIQFHTKDDTICGSFESNRQQIK